MGFSYKPLWHLLIERNMGKEDLRKQIKTSSSTIAKMGKGEYVSMEVLDKICAALDCKVEDIIEYIPDKRG